MEKADTPDAPELEGGELLEPQLVPLEPLRSGMVYAAPPLSLHTPEEERKIEEEKANCYEFLQDTLFFTDQLLTGGCMMHHEHHFSWQLGITGGNLPLTGLTSSTWA